MCMYLTATRTTYTSKMATTTTAPVHPFARKYISQVILFCLFLFPKKCRTPRLCRMSLYKLLFVSLCVIFAYAIYGRRARVRGGGGKMVVMVDRTEKGTTYVFYVVHFCELSAKLP